jgi:hypothetical protein
LTKLQVCILQLRGTVLGGHQSIAKKVLLGVIAVATPAQRAMGCSARPPIAHPQKNSFMWMFHVIYPPNSCEI